MGGEWIFSFDGEQSTFDLKAYQIMLKSIYEAYNNRTDWGEDNGKVRWTGEEIPTDNIFADFTYDCTRHNWHGNPSWKLLWDPTKEKYFTDVHARCASYQFKKLSFEIQEKLCKSFPNHFSLELGDGKSGVDDYYHSRTGSYSYGRDYDSYSDVDMTACDKECGYCGKCWY